LLLTVSESVDIAALTDVLERFGCAIEEGWQPGFSDLGPLALDWRSGVLHRGQRTVSLTPKEMAVLCYLASRPGEIVTRRELEREVFGCAEQVETRRLDTHMAALRRKIEADPRRPVHLVTVRGQGFRFEP
jgi:two-component system response regulator RegX3